MEKRLYRSDENKVLCGVCGGVQRAGAVCLHCGSHHHAPEEVLTKKRGTSQDGDAGKLNRGNRLRAYS